MTRKEMLMKELESGEYRAIYKLIRRSTDKYCKSDCADNWDPDEPMCIETKEKKCIKAWLESEVPENQKFFSE